MKLDAGSFLIGLGAGAMAVYVLDRYANGARDDDVLTPPALVQQEDEMTLLGQSAGLGMQGAIPPDAVYRSPNPAPQPVYQPRANGEFQLPGPVEGILRKLVQSGTSIVQTRIHDGVQWMIDDALRAPVGPVAPQPNINAQAIEARLRQSGESPYY